MENKEKQQEYEKWKAEWDKKLSKEYSNASNMYNMGYERGHTEGKRRSGGWWSGFFIGIIACFILNTFLGMAIVSFTEASVA